jgi:hypothetical protein
MDLAFFSAQALKGYKIVRAAVCRLKFSTANHPALNPDSDPAQAPRWGGG